jgi:hypothetical protein
MHASRSTLAAARRRASALGLVVLLGGAACGVKRPPRPPSAPAPVAPSTVTATATSASAG